MGYEHFWTSGTDQGDEGKFFWMSTGQPLTFENWNSAEPNNFMYVSYINLFSTKLSIIYICFIFVEIIFVLFYLRILFYTYIDMKMENLRIVLNYGIVTEED